MLAVLLRGLGNWRLQILSPKKVILLVGVLLMYVVIALVLRYESDTPSSLHSRPKPMLLLWWNALPQAYESTRYCGPHKCTFTGNRASLAAAKGILFYGSDLMVDNFPLPRLPHHIWGLLHEESPRNVPYISHEIILQHFNLTSTFSRYSDHPLTTMHLPIAEQLTSPAYMVPVGEKTVLRKRENLAPIAFLQTDCDTSSGRENYVRELMRHVDIDSLGGCLHNRDLPASLNNTYKNYLETVQTSELYRFLSRYKFIIAYENAVCNDYITEKFWRPLIVGSIPIFFGSPTIKDWEPNPKSAIHINDFPSPAALANFIKKLDANDTEYNSYLNHKYDLLEPIFNNHLRHELLTRDISSEDPNIFSNFECFVCSRLHEMKAGFTYKATSEHYECPLPLVYPPIGNGSYPHNHWSSIMAVGRCQAHILDRLLVRNKNYTKFDFEVLLKRAVQENKCH